MAKPDVKLPVKPVAPADLVVNDNWGSRRRVLFLALIFIGVLVAYLTILGKDTAIGQQAAIALIASGTALLTGYIFGAVWDDHNKRMFFKNMPGLSGGDDCAPPPPPPPEGA